jgi:hypothetical protein
LQQQSLHRSRIGELEDDLDDAIEVPPRPADAEALAKLEAKVDELARALDASERARASASVPPAPAVPPSSSRRPDQEVAPHAETAATSVVSVRPTPAFSGPFHLSHQWQRLPDTTIAWTAGLGYASMARAAAAALSAAAVAPPGGFAALRAAVAAVGPQWAAVLPCETQVSDTQPPRVRIPAVWELILPVPNDTQARTALVTYSPHPADAPTEVRLKVTRKSTIRELRTAFATQMGIDPAVLLIFSPNGNRPLRDEETVEYADVFMRRPTLSFVPPLTDAAVASIVDDYTNATLASTVDDGLAAQMDAVEEALPPSTLAMAAELIAVREAAAAAVGRSQSPEAMELSALVDASATEREAVIQVAEQRLEAELAAPAAAAAASAPAPEAAARINAKVAAIASRLTSITDVKALSTADLSLIQQRAADILARAAGARAMLQAVTATATTTAAGHGVQAAATPAQPQAAATPAMFSPLKSPQYRRMQGTDAVQLQNIPAVLQAQRQPTPASGASAAPGGIREDRVAAVKAALGYSVRSLLDALVVPRAGIAPDAVVEERAQWEAQSLQRTQQEPGDTAPSSSSSLALPGAAPARPPVSSTAVVASDSESEADSSTGSGEEADNEEGLSRGRRAGTTSAEAGEDSYSFDEDHDAADTRPPAIPPVATIASSHSELVPRPSIVASSQTETSRSLSTQPQNASASSSREDDARTTVIRAAAMDALSPASDLSTSAPAHAQTERAAATASGGGLGTGMVDESVLDLADRYEAEARAQLEQQHAQAHVPAPTARQAARGSPTTASLHTSRADTSPNDSGEHDVVVDEADAEPEVDDSVQFDQTLGNTGTISELSNTQTTAVPLNTVPPAAHYDMGDTFFTMSNSALESQPLGVAAVDPPTAAPDLLTSVAGSEPAAEQAHYARPSTSRGRTAAGASPPSQHLNEPGPGPAGGQIRPSSARPRPSTPPRGPPIGMVASGSSTARSVATLTVPAGNRQQARQEPVLPAASQVNPSTTEDLFGLDDFDTNF